MRFFATCKGKLEFFVWYQVCSFQTKRHQENIKMRKSSKWQFRHIERNFFILTSTQKKCSKRDAQVAYYFIPYQHKKCSIFNMTTLSLNDQGQSFPQFHPGFSKHQEGDRSHLCSYPPFKWSMSLTGVAYTLSLTYPHRKKLRGVRSGDLRGQAWGPSLPIHL